MVWTQVMETARQIEKVLEKEMRMDADTRYVLAKKIYQDYGSIGADEVVPVAVEYLQVGVK